MPLVARNSRWLAIRLSSHISMRIHTARSGMSLVDAEQLLGGHREHQLVEERAEVVHPGDVGAALQVGQRLAGLLHPGVQVADDRLAAQDGLALQLEHEAQHAVGAGVLRPHVDDHRLVLVAGRPGGHRAAAASASLIRSTAPSSRISSLAATSDARLELLLRLDVWIIMHDVSHGVASMRATERQRGSAQQRPAWPGTLMTARLELHGDRADLVVLAQGVALPVLGHQDPRQVGVVGEDDAEHVERLALHRLGAGMDVEQRGQRRVVGGHLHADRMRRRRRCRAG